MKTINTYIILLLTYSFVIASWSETDFESLERIVRIIMKESLHIRFIKVYTTEKRHSVAIIDMHNLHNSQIKQLRIHWGGGEVPRTMNSV